MQYFLIGLFTARTLMAASEIWMLSKDPDVTPRKFWTLVGVGLINLGFLYGVAFHY